MINHYYKLQFHMLSKSTYSKMYIGMTFSSIYLTSLLNQKVWDVSFLHSSQWVILCMDFDQNLYRWGQGYQKHLLNQLSIQKIVNLTFYPYSGQEHGQTKESGGVWRMYISVLTVMCMTMVGRIQLKDLLPFMRYVLPHGLQLLSSPIFVSSLSGSYTWQSDT